MEGNPGMRFVENIEQLKSSQTILHRNIETNRKLREILKIHIYFKLSQHNVYHIQAISGFSLVHSNPLSAKKAYFRNIRITSSQLSVGAEW